jgi:large subunit ribosomal protein L15
MKLHELAPPKGAKSERRRVGRGHGSGRGKTSGKGVKGQKARSGGKIPAYFEGGQLPLVRKLPYRRGFNNPFRVEYEIVNIGDLERLTETSVSPESLRAAGLIRRGQKPVKVLGQGTLQRAVTVQAHAFSGTARQAIEAAGGTVTVIGGEPSDA